MKKIIVSSLISLLSLPVVAGSVDLKNCLKVNYQKVCLPDNNALFKALKDEKNESKQKQCFKNFMKNRLLNIKLKEHGLLYFQAERHQGAEITVVFSKQTKVPKMNIDGVLQARRGTLILPELSQQWCRVDIQQKMVNRTEKLVNEFYFDSRTISSIPQILFEARNGVEFEVCFEPESQSLQTSIIGSGEFDYTEPEQCLPDNLAELVQNALMTSEADCDEFAEAMVKLTGNEDTTISDENIEEHHASLYDVNKAMCEFNNVAIRDIKEKAQGLNSFCEYGGSVIEEKSGELSKASYKFFVNGRQINLPRVFSIHGYPDDISLEQSLEIFRMSEEENIPSDLLFNLAKVIPTELSRTLEQIQAQSSWLEKVVQDAKQGVGSDGQTESGQMQNFDSYYEDEDGNIFDPTGNLVTDEATIEGYYQSHSNKPVKYENGNNQSEDGDEPLEDDGNEPTNDEEGEPSDEEEPHDDSNLGEGDEEGGDFEDEEEE